MSFHIARVSRWLILFACLLLAACGGTASETQPPPTQPVSATATLQQAALTSAPLPSQTPDLAGTFQNPVLRSNFPDPFILQVGDTFYVYATNGSSKNVQLATSTDLIHWSIKTDAMPSVPSWAQLGGSYIWAPEVIQIGDQFVLYYTARDKAADKQCVGVAVSSKPEGKFKDTRDAPLVCQAKEGGTIDASPFRDGDKLYLYFKNDGNCCSLATYIYVQELAPDGLSLVGEPTRLFRNDKPWEGTVIEAPTMFKHDDRYYLFYSANFYAGFEYSVGYAVCDSPTGPCEKASENPILRSSLDQPPVIGPGHQDIVELNGETWLAYHAWEVNQRGTKTDRRLLWLDRLVWQDGKPVVQGPTTGRQPVPVVP